MYIVVGLLLLIRIFKLLLYTFDFKFHCKSIELQDISTSLAEIKVRHQAEAILEMETKMFSPLNINMTVSTNNTPPPQKKMTACKSQNFKVFKSKMYMQGWDTSTNFVILGHFWWQTVQVCDYMQQNHYGLHWLCCAHDMMANHEIQSWSSRGWKFLVGRAPKPILSMICMCYLKIIHFYLYLFFYFLKIT